MLCEEYEVHAGKYHVCGSEASVEVVPGRWMCVGHAKGHPAVFLTDRRHEIEELQYAEAFR